MDSRLSDCSVTSASGPLSDGRHFTAGICLHDDRANVPADHRAGLGYMDAYAKGAPLRQLQVLADFLIPLAGEDAGRLADQLLERFGSLARIFAASVADLEGILGRYSGASQHLVAARDMVDTARRDELSGERVDPADPALLGYLRGLFSAASQERLHAIFCDAQQRFIRDDTLGEGSRRNVTLRVAPLLRRAVALDAGGILLAHNHPSGDCRPSGDDIRATHELQDLAGALEIDIIDHLIFAPGKAYSMRAGGHLRA